VRIEGSSALVTGATGGIGEAISRALAGRGADVVLTGRRTDVLEPLAQELGGRALACDLSDRDALEPLLAGAGRVDILVANAALPADGPIDEYEIEQIDRALDVNLRAPILMARALGPAMRDRGEGHMVFISSLSGKAATAGSSLYSATKYGLRGFALGLREDLRESGVGVSTVFPGFIRDAGMFADSRVELPRGVGTRSPQDVAGAVISAIERNRAEVDVAPLSLRLGAAMASLAPATSAAVARRMGGTRLAEQIADSEAHRSRR
jgi:short-subunit dehydrogenase